MPGWPVRRVRRRFPGAAGDLTPGEQLIQIAAGKGTLAGIACATSLKPV